MEEHIGFVGLGVMGQKMAANLMRHQGIAITNRTPSRGAALVEMGADWCETPAAVARVSTIIFTMVSDDDALRAVVEGEGGLLHEIKPGTVVVDHSTVSPALTKDLAKKVQSRGAAWLDAPVTGGDVGAQNGTLTIMVGGEEGDFTRVRPFLEQMGQRILHVGAVGQGQTLKLISNMVSAINLMAAAEGLQFGLHQNLALDDLAAVMNWGSAQSYELTKVLDRYSHNNFAPGFSVANRLKDLRLAVNLAKESGYTADLGACALPFYEAHDRQGYHDQDEASYVLRWQSAEREN
ncbi:MAG: hypothetical protein C7B44_04400 [Sulfobacillus thermosulfidooxidans]|nr:MAG: hypothetical protein C7B44_04400 [Sulfobacillus thermosulfidooxidans]